MRGVLRAVRGLQGRRAKLSLVLSICTCAALLAFTASAGALVFHVGTFEGKRGKMSLQKAVEAAAPGDWILVAPGDYKETGDHVAAGGTQGAGVLVEKPGIHIRGMNRNGVIIDGTKKHTPPCSSNPADQELGPADSGGHHSGRNGIEIFKVAGVSVENLTVCNFQAGNTGAGNEIWFNFGDGSGKQMAGAWRGA